MENLWSRIGLHRWVLIAVLRRGLSVRDEPAPPQLARVEGSPGSEMLAATTGEAGVAAPVVMPSVGAGAATPEVPLDAAEAAARGDTSETGSVPSTDEVDEK